MDRKIYGLLGRKLGHSYSVPIHKKLGNSGYRLYELEPEQLGDFIRREDLGGVNVTIPYKVDAMRFCDEISPEASSIGAVNTIVRRNGKVCGYNTDRYGFIHMLERGGIGLKDRKVLILGSGGASRTACYCADELGAGEITVISRTGPDNYGNIGNHRDAEIIINTTPVGMFPDNGHSPVDLEMFGRCIGVVDMIYNPLRTKLLMDAEKLCIPNIGGLSMLTAQAKKAAELFTDSKIDDSITDRITGEMIRENENIVLIGMPGSGKTTVGKILSSMTGRELIETDSEIEKISGMTIPGIFARDGEKAFRDIESSVIERAGKQSGKIIVTGGGAVTVPCNYGSLKQNGRIYEITRDIFLLETAGRPLSEGRDLGEMYRTRRPMYDRFRDVSVSNAGTPEETAENVWRDFNENTHNQRT